MADDQDASREEVIQKLYTFVVEQMKAGSDRSAIAEKLVSMGVNREGATALVDAMHDDVVQTASREQFTAEAFVPAAVGGGLAALVGGAVWGGIVIATGYEIGYMASAIGVLAGYAVVLFARGRKGPPLQALAVLASLLGILVGKYLTFFYYLSRAAAEKYGAEATAGLSILSARVIDVFLENVGSMVNGFDVLWVILAVVAAWRIPRSLGVLIPSHQQVA